MSLLGLLLLLYTTVFRVDVISIFLFVICVVVVVAVVVMIW